ncbi:MAG: type II secretion system F family protein [Propionibacteriaceae bacterium]|jgi:Flp pilus assembly protein TadB|nr:type II secretion system F family protein [Propionibacteriaceae bacterium]
MIGLDVATLQWSLVAGGLFGAGIALIVAWLVPNRPQLAAFLDELSAPTQPGGESRRERPSDWLDRLGRRLMRLVPQLTLPIADLDLLRVPPQIYLARRFVSGALGFGLVTMVTAVLVALGYRPPILIPVAVSLGLGLVASLLPGLSVKQRAAARRDEFSFAFGAYVDLVATEHHSGSGTRQAMEVAATGGDSWMFERLAEELRRSRLTGQSPWDALERLGDRIGLADLADFAAVMRLSGEEGGAIYETLRARAATMRQTRLAKEVAEANQTGERISAVTALLAIVFLFLVGAPAVLRFLAL